MHSNSLTTSYRRAYQWAQEALDLLFPPVCAACNALGPLICDNCRDQFLKIPSPLCWRCGRSLLYAAPVCPECIQPSFILQQVRAPFAYKEPLSRVIHRLKYDGLFALAKPLASLMHASWPEWEINPQIIVPIPLHKRRERQRGFNQSALLAKHLANDRGLLLLENALKREKNTRPQIGLTPAERKANVQNAFAAGSQQVKGKHILLIDDVYTTGATMSAAASALLASGAVTVSAYCLARAV